MAGTVEKIKAKVDQVLHKDKTTDATGTHNTSTGIGSSGTHTGTTGHSTTGGLTGSSTTGTHGTHGTTGHGTSGYSDPTGPHDSSLANKADPRVDSDRYGTAGNTSGAGGHGTGQYGEGHGTTGGLTGHSTTGGGLTGHSGTGGGLTGHSGTGGGLTGHSGTGGGLTGHSGTGSGLTGHSTTGGYGSTGRSDPTGPHDSHLANKADPRVDSDQYGTAGNTSGAGGYGTGQYGSTGHSTTGHGTTGHSSSGGGLTSALGGVFSGSKSGSDPTGPHNTRTANILDPRVDSDQYGSAGNTTGAGGYSSTTGSHGHSGTTGHTGTAGGLGHSSHNDPTGPHDSHLANKADPRVDSDRYGTAGNTSGAGGYGTGQYGEGHHGTTGHSTTGGLGHSSHSDPTGPHDSHLANKADPRVDSDRYGTAGNTSGAGGYGTGQYGEGHHGTTGHGTTGTTGELPHRPNEDGSLPKALTEDHSVAQPHSSTLEGNQHSTGTHGTHGTHGTDAHKPSLKDKLNPKVDADGDGKAGFLK